ncbi:hypothetical protein DXG03_000512 [Asterophora parasitica]|uniref:histidine--tRNA ligase n=1 Tax=Asterophora parasitica TaxID=117018 RepID=A0A9P7KC17_9AGAR|nr:hypothetical protein DXG03_000512 [Asterophora parasitica]
MTEIDATQLQAEIEQFTARFNELRKSGTANDEVEETKKRLGELKKTLAVANAKAKGAKKDEGKDVDGADDKKRERLLLKTAKGTRDYGPAEMHCRAHIEATIKSVFTLYGGGCLDTPVFERKDVLQGKYGEDAKLIFDLQDQGGEQLALRYDHTVPLARYLAMVGRNETENKLWQVGKVYRRDNPVMSKGRMREFMQADFDIAGTWDPMIPDGEILSMLCTILTRLDVGEFTVKINHRKILDGIFEVCGVPTEKIRPISSAVDKLDKLPWDEVKKEMTDEKGLDPAIADRIGEYVKHKGGPELLEKLNTDATLTSNKKAKEGLVDMGILFTLLKAYRVLDKISFDLSLARGLDYYTGIIYEAVVEASAPPGFKEANALASGSTPAAAAVPPPKPKKASPKKPADEDDEPEIDESQVGVGSIAAGGRYDGLVGMFNAAAAGAGKKAQEIPCVGVSIGMDRVFAIVWPKWVERGMRSKETMVYVVSMGDGLLEERVRLAGELRGAGIKTDFLAKNKPKHQTQFAASEKDEVPFAIIIAPDELAAGFVRVKEQKWQFVDGEKVKVKAEGDKGVQVRRDELIQWLRDTPTLREWDSGRLV